MGKFLTIGTVGGVLKVLCPSICYRTLWSQFQGSSRGGVTLGDPGVMRWVTLVNGGDLMSLC
jgi:hypothetical protein